MTSRKRFKCLKIRYLQKFKEILKSEIYCLALPHITLEGGWLKARLKGK